MKEPSHLLSAAKKFSEHQAIFWVLIAGLYIRLVLAFFPGHPDVKDAVMWVADVQKGGLSSITKWGGGGIPQYPPGFIYEAGAGAKLVNLLARQKPVGDVTAITPWARLGVRVVPMVCDLLAAILLYFVVAKVFSRTPALWAASLYLFNPGVIANSALWNLDAVPSFLMLASILLCALAFEKSNHAWLPAASAVCALAFGVKLQAGMLVPVVGAIVLLTKQVRMVILTVLAFIAVNCLLYAPFLLHGNWEYLRRIFFVSFEYGHLTHLNAYNAWALWFQVPNTIRVMGVTLGNIGNIVYLASVAYAVYLLLTKKQVQAPPHDATRRFTIVGAYLCATPFIVLTQMHERYLAMAIPFAVLAGFLDRRLMPVGIGFSITYALNMLVVGVNFWHPWSSVINENSQYFEPIRMVVIFNRVFCSLLNVALFIWLTARLRVLLATRPGENVSSDPEIASPALSRASS